jgi:penicillin-binding protein 2
MSYVASSRPFIVRIIFIATAIIILLRLFYIQVIEDKYKILANDIAIYRKIVFPPRGVIYDRKGHVMLYNQVVYDLVVTPNDIKKEFDTTTFCDALRISKDQFCSILKKIRIKNGPMRQGIFFEQLTPAQTARYQENMYQFNGFELVERSIRTYPDSVGGALLGYIGEVSPAMLKKDRYASYHQGDYLGMTGLEQFYEEELRGQRGVYFIERDKFNRPTGPYKNGELDTPAVGGKSLQLYLDAALQKYGEQLMANKLGSVVAIDPSTGGILAMVSSPTYDPNLLRGSNRAKNFAKLQSDATLPMFNRAIKASYNPGSTMKPLTALVALDMGVVTPSFGYPCSGGYYACGRKIGCTHEGAGHAANLRLALANSCNAYFCHLYRLSVDARKWGDVKIGLHKWYEYMSSFGLGHATGIDIPYEGSGTLFDSKDYDAMYQGSWNSCTNVFLGMGQGEVALTPLQLANAMCIVANHGFYYTPHFVKAIGNKKQVDKLKPFLEKHQVTHISDSTFSTVAYGMMDVVDKGTGMIARIPGLEICAKTGTVENKAVVNGVAMKMKNHSMFVAFAPRVNPKIAIAVIVENAGFGATWAGPIASLMIEQYLKDTIAFNRKGIESNMFNAKLISSYTYLIDSARRKKDRAIWDKKQALKNGLLNERKTFKSLLETSKKTGLH